MYHWYMSSYHLPIINNQRIISKMIRWLLMIGRYVSMTHRLHWIIVDASLMNEKIHIVDSTRLRNQKTLENPYLHPKYSKKIGACGAKSFKSYRYKNRPIYYTGNVLYRNSRTLARRDARRCAKQTSCRDLPYIPITTSRSRDSLDSSQLRVGAMPQRQIH